MSSARRKLTLSSVSVNLGCGTCRRPKLALIFGPKPKLKNQKHKLHHQPHSSSSFNDNSSTVKGFGRVVGKEGVAVEKDSDDPYLDFRHSMLQMILENEIYSKDGLRELLNCFLQINSPQHHGVIVRAFTEIWNGVFSVRSSSSPRFHLNHTMEEIYVDWIRTKDISLLCVYCYKAL